MIYLKFNNLLKDEECYFSQETFTPDILAFFEEDNYGKLVKPSVAMQRGFTITEENFEKLLEILWKGMICNCKD